MSTGLVSRHFGKVTPQNNPWRTLELEQLRARHGSPLPRIRWPSDPSDVTLDLVHQLLYVFKACSCEPKSLRKHMTFANLTRLLSQAQKMLVRYPNVLNIRLPGRGTRLTVVGDTHGQFHDVLRIFEQNGEPSPHNWYVFNGDLVDRGSWGLEIAVTLFAYKILYPESVHIIRGNHETLYCTRIYGFLQECKHKYSKAIHAKFQQTFSRIPLAAVILPFLQPNQQSFERRGDGRGIFVVHGGLFRNPDGSLGSIDDLMQLTRFIKDPESEMFLDILWSDPQAEDGLLNNHLRGCATLYGPNKTLEFLQRHGLHLMIRSHEGPDAREKRSYMEFNMMKGFAIDQRYDNGNPLLITIFSAPDYPQGPKARGNLAAFIVFDGASPHLEPNIRQFQKADDRPDVLPYPSEQKDLTDLDRP